MIRLNKPIVISIIIGCLFLSCKNNTPLILFKDKKHVAKISFEYSTMGHITVKCTVKKDTFNFIFDTGANISVISPNIPNDDLITKALGVDIHNQKEIVSICRVGLIQCGDINFNNLVVAQMPISIKAVDGIIGRDVLDKLCIKIDNKNKELLLTKNSDLIDKKGVKKSFDPLKSSVSLSLGSDSVECYFLFDTGYVGEISIDSNTAHSSTIENLPSTLWKIPEYGIFRKQNSERYTTVSFFLNEVYLDTLTFKNIILEYDKSKNKNLVGSVFLRKFKSVTIDYLNHTMFFELPGDNSVVHFSNKHINNFNLSALNLLYSRIRSLGIRFSEHPPFVVTELLHHVNNQIVNIGDTLVGIDNVLFIDPKDCKAPLKKSCDWEANISKQKDLIHKTLNQKKTTTLHFFVENKLTSQRFTRKKIIQSLPKIAYSYNNRNQDLSYYAINFAIEPQKNFMVHIPWASLSGETVKISTYKNGVEQKTSNIAY